MTDERLEPLRETFRRQAEEIVRRWPEERRMWRALFGWEPERAAFRDELRYRQERWERVLPPAVREAMMARPELRYPSEVAKDFMEWFARQARGLDAVD